MCYIILEYRSIQCSLSDFGRIGLVARPESRESTLWGWDSQWWKIPVPQRRSDICECQYTSLASLERVDVHWKSNCRCNCASEVQTCQYRIGLYGMKRDLISCGKPSSGKSILEHQQHDRDIQSQLHLDFLPHRCQFGRLHDLFLILDRVTTLR